MIENLPDIIAAGTGALAAVTGSVYMVVKVVIKNSYSEEIRKIKINMVERSELIGVERKISEISVFLKSKLTGIEKNVSELSDNIKEKELKENNLKDFREQLENILKENLKVYGNSEVDKKIQNFAAYKANSFMEFCKKMRCEITRVGGNRQEQEELKKFLKVQVAMYQVSVYNHGRKLLGKDVVEGFYTEKHDRLIHRHIENLCEIVEGPGNHKLLYFENEAKSFLRKFLLELYIWSRKNKEKIREAGSCKEKLYN